MSPRRAVRDLIIRSAIAAGLDGRWRERDSREARRRGLSLVRVVSLHGTPGANADGFRRQVEWASENLSLIDFETLARHWDRGNAKPDGDGRTGVLFTFDDGLASNYEVAAPILEAAGTRGVFFVVAGFAQREGEEARRFFCERISSESDAAQFPEELWKPMSPEQVADLAARGHTIGNHTLSHAYLSPLPPSEQYREIVDAAELLRSWTKKSVDAFSWTHTWSAIDATAWRVARQTHRFCFSPCPGTVEAGVDSPALIWRTNVEPFYPPHQYRFMYSGLTDPFWARRRRRLRELLAQVEDTQSEVPGA